jgi:hypothetical protein
MRVNVIGVGRARSWNAFVCPDCRFVFRVPGDHDGMGVVCPSCRMMMKIPREGDVTPPLMAPLRRVVFSEQEEIEPRMEKRRRGKRKRLEKKAEVPDWDASAGVWKSTNGRKMTKRMGVISVILFLVVSGGMVVMFWDSFRVKGEGEVAGGDYMKAGKSGVDEKLLLEEEELAGVENFPSILKRSEVDFLSDAEQMAEKFLNAESVDEILPLIRNAKALERRVRKHYEGGRIEPLGISKFNSSGVPMYKDEFGAVQVETKDFERKVLAFVEGKEGLKIDWESWVGLADMPWEEIMEKRPKEALMVRVSLRISDYYNFEFADDKEWMSYRLLSPGGDHLLYGYVARGSLLDQQVKPKDKKTTETKILKIRFPEGGSSKNLVIIEEMVTDGWVFSE